MTLCMTESGTTTHKPEGVAVSLRHVSRTFPNSGRKGTGAVPAVENIDLEIGAGEFVAMLGPSGCGKTTLLRMVAALDRPDGGQVIVGGDSAKSRGSVAYVFQDAHLLPWRDALGNTALPLELLGVSKPARQATARAALEQVGLAEAIHRYPAQLSGGMRMRVSLARALVTQPRLLLLDEPFAALDEITRQGLDEQLRVLWLQRGMTVLFVTHSIGEAAFLAQRAVVLTPRPARIVVDRLIDLPQDRPTETRGTPEYARQVAQLLDALRRGGSLA